MGSPEAQAAEILFQSASFEDKPFSLDLPMGLGEYRKIFRDVAKKNQPQIILIEDAHASIAAQNRIFEILSYLNSHQKLDAVFLEGAAENLGATNFTQKDEILNRLMAAGLINGASKFVLKYPRISAWGLEKPDLYRRNLDLYRKVTSAYEEEPILALIRRRVVRQAEQRFSKEVRSILKAQEDYRGNWDLKTYANLLFEISEKKLGIQWTSPRLQQDWPFLSRFYQVQNLETNLNVDRAQAQWRSLKLILRGFSRDQIEWMDLQVHQFLNGKNLDQAVSFDPRYFAESLMAFSTKQGVILEQFPDFNQLLAILVFQNEIKIDGLEGDVQNLESKIFSALITRFEDQKWLEMYQDWQRLKRAFRLELSRKEYESFARDSNRWSESSLVKSFQIHEAGEVRGWSVMLQRISKFYRSAQTRESVFVQTLQSQLKTLACASSSKPCVVALVAGGFHTEGVQQLLKEQGLNHLVIQPRFQLEEKGLHYDRIMMGQYADSTLAAAQAVLMRNENLAVKMMGRGAFERYQASLHQILGIRQSLPAPEKSYARNEVRKQSRPAKVWTRRAVLQSLIFGFAAASEAASHLSQAIKAYQEPIETAPAQINPEKKKVLDYEAIWDLLSKNNLAIRLAKEKIRQAQAFARIRTASFFSFAAGPSIKDGKVVWSGSVTGSNPLGQATVGLQGPMGEGARFTFEMALQIFRWIKGEVKLKDILGAAEIAIAAYQYQEEMDRQYRDASIRLVEIASKEEELRLSSELLETLKQTVYPLAVERQRAGRETFAIVSDIKTAILNLTHQIAALKTELNDLRTTLAHQLWTNEQDQASLNFQVKISFPEPPENLDLPSLKEAATRKEGDMAPKNRPLAAAFTSVYAAAIQLELLKIDQSLDFTGSLLSWLDVGSRKDQSAVGGSVTGKGVFGKGPRTQKELALSRLEEARILTLQALSDAREEIQKLVLEIQNDLKKAQALQEELTEIKERLKNLKDNGNTTEVDRFKDEMNRHNTEIELILIRSRIEMARLRLEVLGALSTSRWGPTQIVKRRSELRKTGLSLVNKWMLSGVLGMMISQSAEASVWPWKWKFHSHGRAPRMEQVETQEVSAPKNFYRASGKGAEALLNSMNKRAAQKSENFKQPPEFKITPLPSLDQTNGHDVSMPVKPSITNPWGNSTKSLADVSGSIPEPEQVISRDLPVTSPVKEVKDEKTSSDETQSPVNVPRVFAPEIKSKPTDSAWQGSPISQHQNLNETQATGISDSTEEGGSRPSWWMRNVGWKPDWSKTSRTVSKLNPATWFGKSKASDEVETAVAEKDKKGKKEFQQEAPQKLSLEEWKKLPKEERSMALIEGRFDEEDIPDPLEEIRKAQLKSMSGTANRFSAADVPSPTVKTNSSDERIVNPRPEAESRAEKPSRSVPLVSSSAPKAPSFTQTRPAHELNKHLGTISTLSPSNSSETSVTQFPQEAKPLEFQERTWPEIGMETLSVTNQVSFVGYRSAESALSGQVMVPGEIFKFPSKGNVRFLNPEKKVYQTGEPILQITHPSVSAKHAQVNPEMGNIIRAPFPLEIVGPLPPTVAEIGDPAFEYYPLRYVRVQLELPPDFRFEKNPAVKMFVQSNQGSREVSGRVLSVEAGALDPNTRKIQVVLGMEVNRDLDINASILKLAFHPSALQTSSNLQPDLVPPVKPVYHVLTSGRFRTVLKSPMEGTIHFIHSEGDVVQPGNVARVLDFPDLYADLKVDQAGALTGIRSFQNQFVSRGAKVGEIASLNVQIGNPNASHLNEVLLVKAGTVHEGSPAFVMLPGGAVIEGQVTHVVSAPARSDFEVRALESLTVSAPIPFTLGVDQGIAVSVAFPRVPSDLEVWRNFVKTSSVSNFSQGPWIRVASTPNNLPAIPVWVASSNAGGTAEELSKRTAEEILNEGNPIVALESLKTFSEQNHTQDFYAQIEKIILQGSPALARAGLRILIQDQALSQIIGIWAQSGDSASSPKNLLREETYRMIQDLLTADAMHTTTIPARLRTETESDPALKKQTSNFLVYLLEHEDPNSWAVLSLLRNGFLVDTDLVAFIKAHQTDHPVAAQMLYAELLRRENARRLSQTNLNPSTDAIEKGGSGRSRPFDLEVDNRNVRRIQDADRQLALTSPTWNFADWSSVNPEASRNSLRSVRAQLPDYQSPEAVHRTSTQEQEALSVLDFEMLSPDQKIQKLKELSSTRDFAELARIFEKGYAHAIDDAALAALGASPEGRMWLMGILNRVSESKSSSILAWHSGKVSFADLILQDAWNLERTFITGKFSVSPAQMDTFSRTLQRLYDRETDRNLRDQILATLIALKYAHPDQMAHLLEAASGNAGWQSGLDHFSLQDRNRVLNRLIRRHAYRFSVNHYRIMDGVRFWGDQHVPGVQSSLWDRIDQLLDLSLWNRYGFAFDSSESLESALQKEFPGFKGGEFRAGWKSIRNLGDKIFRQTLKHKRPYVPFWNHLLSPVTYWVGGSFTLAFLIVTVPRQWNRFRRFLAARRPVDLSEEATDEFVRQAGELMDKLEERRSRPRRSPRSESRNEMRMTLKDRFNILKDLASKKEFSPKDINLALNTVKLIINHEDMVFDPATLVHLSDSRIEGQKENFHFLMMWARAFMRRLVVDLEHRAERMTAEEVGDFNAAITYLADVIHYGAGFRKAIHFLGYFPTISSNYFYEHVDVKKDYWLNRVNLWLHDVISKYYYPPLRAVLKIDRSREEATELFLRYLQTEIIARGNRLEEGLYPNDILEQSHASIDQYFDRSVHPANYAGNRRSGMYRRFATRFGMVLTIPLSLIFGPVMFALHIFAVKVDDHDDPEFFNLEAVKEASFICRKAARVIRTVLNSSQSEDPRAFELTVSLAKLNEERSLTQPTIPFMICVKHPDMKEDEWGQLRQHLRYRFPKTVFLFEDNAPRGDMNVYLEIRRRIMQGAYSDLFGSHPDLSSDVALVHKAFLFPFPGAMRRLELAQEEEPYRHLPSEIREGRYVAVDTRLAMALKIASVHRSTRHLEILLYGNHDVITSYVPKGVVTNVGLWENAQTAISRKRGVLFGNFSNGGKIIKRLQAPASGRLRNTVLRLRTDTRSASSVDTTDEDHPLKRQYVTDAGILVLATSEDGVWQNLQTALSGLDQRRKDANEELVGEAHRQQVTLNPNYLVLRFGWDWLVTWVRAMNQSIETAVEQDADHETGLSETPAVDGHAAARARKMDHPAIRADAYERFYDGFQENEIGGRLPEIYAHVGHPLETVSFDEREALPPQSLPPMPDESPDPKSAVRLLSAGQDTAEQQVGIHEMIKPWAKVWRKRDVYFTQVPVRLQGKIYWVVIFAESEEDLFQQFNARNGDATFFGDWKKTTRKNFVDPEKNPIFSDQMEFIDAPLYLLREKPVPDDSTPDEIDEIGNRLLKHKPVTLDLKQLEGRISLRKIYRNFAADEFRKAHGSERSEIRPIKVSTQPGRDRHQERIALLTAIRLTHKILGLGYQGAELAQMLEQMERISLDDAGVENRLMAAWNLNPGGVRKLSKELERFEEKTIPSISVPDNNYLFLDASLIENDKYLGRLAERLDHVVILFDKDKVRYLRMKKKWATKTASRKIFWELASDGTSSFVNQLIQPAKSSKISVRLRNALGIGDEADANRFAFIASSREQAKKVSARYVRSRIFLDPAFLQGDDELRYWTLLLLKREMNLFNLSHENVINAQSLVGQWLQDFLLQERASSLTSQAA